MSNPMQYQFSEKHGKFLRELTQQEQLLVSQNPLGCLQNPQFKNANKIKKNIIFVTGTRADFGKLEPLITAARDYGHTISIFITGMHLIERYGLTKIEVRRMRGYRFTNFTINQIMTLKTSFFQKQSADSLVLLMQQSLIW